MRFSNDDGFAADKVADAVFVVTEKYCIISDKPS
jgi:hypothetical protein